MKTFYKTLVLGVFLTALAVATPTFAQDVCADIPANQALYEGYTKKYKGTLEEKKEAVKAGKEYIQKYGACEAFAEQVKYLQSAVPKKEKEIEAEENAGAEKKRIDRFNAALQAKNTAEIFAAGDDILKNGPESLDLDLTITLATIGLDEAAVKKNDSFNSKTMDYAKSAIKKIESGKTSDKYGIKGFEYDTKDNVLGWMNYTIGYINYYRLKDTETGLNYLYKATQFNAETKDKEFIYALIGDKYVEKADALNKEIIEILKANKGQENFESKTKLALSKGYADRALEAYSKAYDVAKANMNKEKDPANKTKLKEYSDNLFSTLKGLYKFRYETIEKPIADADLVTQLNSLIASTASKQLTNPTTAVTPVDPPSEDEKTTDSTTSTTTTTPTTSTTPKTSTSTTSKPENKTTTNGTSVKTEADKTNNKPKRKR